MMNRPAFLTFCLLLVIFTAAARAQEQKLVIPVSNPERQGLLKFENPKGSISVTGYDGNLILVTASPRFKSENRSKDPACILSYEKQGEIVLLSCLSSGNTIDIDIKVPILFSLQLRSLDNGEVTVIRVSGEIEVDNTNGPILLDNISGSAVLNSVYGDITARFKEVYPQSPMMITSLEGSIELALPENCKAQLKMKSARGTISSEIKLKNIDQPKSLISDWNMAILNGGGPEYILRTYNGNILIKRKLQNL